MGNESRRDCKVGNIVKLLNLYCHICDVCPLDIKFTKKIFIQKVVPKKGRGEEPTLWSWIKSSPVMLASHLGADSWPGRSASGLVPVNGLGEVTED